MKQILLSSQFYMHNLRNEPFGISTVEAIAAGCIPLVHNSGGQKEIVPIELLRFEDAEDAIQKFGNIHNAELDNFKRILSSNIVEYDVETFRKKMKLILKNLIR